MHVHQSFHSLWWFLTSSLWHFYSLQNRLCLFFYPNSSTSLVAINILFCSEKHTLNLMAKTYTTDPPSKQKKNCDILSLLTKWNMIFCSYGAFFENSLSKKNFLSSSYASCVHKKWGEDFLLFFKLTTQ